MANPRSSRICKATRPTTPVAPTMTTLGLLKVTSWTVWGPFCCGYRVRDFSIVTAPGGRNHKLHFYDREHAEAAHLSALLRTIYRLLVEDPSRELTHSLDCAPWYSSKSTTPGSGLTALKMARPSFLMADLSTSGKQMKTLDRRWLLCQHPRPLGLLLERVPIVNDTEMTATDYCRAELAPHLEASRCMRHESVRERVSHFNRNFTQLARASAALQPHQLVEPNS
jgi:hypothetical protein